MKISGEFQLVCPGCKMKTKARVSNVKAPQKLFPTITYVRCETCESELILKLHVAKGQSDRTKIQIGAGISRASQALIDLMREDAEYRAGAAEPAQEEATP